MANKNYPIPSEYCPLWVAEEPMLLRLLHAFVDKCERSVKPLLIINKKSTPELYNYNQENTQHLWRLVTLLKKDYDVLAIELGRKRSEGNVYDNCKLRLNESALPTLRQWLNRPEFIPYAQVWANTIAASAPLFFDAGQALLEKPIVHKTKTAEQVVQSFATISNTLVQAMTLRNLSALCFWGDSKFLDKRGALVTALFPHLRSYIIARPVLINVHLPKKIQGVLFVENQESFLALCQHAPSIGCIAGLALVYSAGFRGAAARIRQTGGAVFSALEAPAHCQLEAFERWWLTSEDDTLPCYFWGDLDYSGMAILAALKNSFAQISAWQPGYSVMLNSHASGIFHSLDAANKEKQKDPGVTGCLYADETLLPLMRRTGGFLDQEVVDVHRLD